MAISDYQAGKLTEAAERCEQILAANPESFEAVHLLAVVQARQGKTEAALENCDRALGLRPDDAQTIYNRGRALAKLARHEEALASWAQALALRPAWAEALNNRGDTLTELGRHDEALASWDQALAVQPDWADALYNRGNALVSLGRYDEALASWARALDVRPDWIDVLIRRGVLLQELNRLDEALASYDQALSIEPDNAPALNNRGSAFAASNRFDEALASYDRALRVRPDHVATLVNRGNALAELGRLDEALASYDRALEIEPDHGHAISGVANCVSKIGQLGRWPEAAQGLARHVLLDESIIAPFVLLHYSDDPRLQRQCASAYAAHKVPLSPEPLWTGEKWRHDKLRVAYLSADFRRHAMSYLIAGMLERHDRSRFEITGVSFGRNDGSKTRRRIIAAFDRFLDVRAESDGDIARRLHDLEIDIAVDLMGYTRHSRPGILGHRPAPIQVSYLGFPGTMGARFIDYVIADEVVAPFADQPHFSESIVHVPDSYWVNDRDRAVSDKTPTRAEVGLPEEGFVFCCFNQNAKITPAFFEVWMRLLHRVENSVLWLFQGNEAVAANLRREAEARGIAPSRLVFARRLPIEQHLARHRLADLFLDTLPCNAHTTAVDALWVGLPVLTCRGEAFAARVAASLLGAVGLPELIAGNLEDYEALATRLATEPAMLSEIRAGLERNRLTTPLFDTDRFRRSIEAAYSEMWEIWQRGEAPHAFAVPSPVDMDEPPPPRRRRVSLRARPS